MQIKESDAIESDWGVTLVTENSRQCTVSCVQYGSLTQGRWWNHLRWRSLRGKQVWDKKKTKHLFCWKLRGPLDTHVESLSGNGHASVSFWEEVRARDTNLKTLLSLRVVPEVLEQWTPAMKNTYSKDDFKITLSITILFFKNWKEHPSQRLNMF